HPPADVEGRTVILVDDGLATGVTAYAAIQWVRRLIPKKIVFAAPLCAAQTANSLSAEVDEMVCGLTPQNLGAVGLWFEDFGQTTDEEVVNLLTDAERKTGKRAYETPHAANPTGPTPAGTEGGTTDG